MHTVQRLHYCLQIAEQLGYSIRQENLGGVPGGACEYGGRKWIFLDVAHNAIEQLEQIRGILWEDPQLPLLDLSRRHRESLGDRHAA